MNLRSVDLNLLVVLDALIEECHVSRAASRLGLSQPATSSALERCRHLFHDPLLERRRGSMQLTPKAEALRLPIRNLLAEITVMVDPPHATLGDLTQTIRITMADYPAIVVINDLHERLMKTAPGIDIIVQPWHGAAAALEGLLKGTIDLAASVFPSADPSIHREELLQEHYTVVMRAEHPARKDFNLERWLGYPHVIVSGRGEKHGALDAALSERGLTRRVGVVVPSFSMVPSLLEGSNLIAMLPSRCVPSDSGGRFALLVPPIQIEGFPLHMAWHTRRGHDIGLQHVIEIVRELLKSAPQGQP